MKHLKPDDLVDAAEGNPTPAAREHLRDCMRCREQAAEAAAVLRRVSPDKIPEPSPLFWSHFSQHVRERIDASSQRQPFAFGLSRWVWAPAGALAIVAAIAVGVSIRQPQRSPDRPVASVAGTPVNADLNASDPGSDTDWAIVAESAEGFEWGESGAGEFAVKPGAAERAAMQLSDDQRRELARLLREEIGRL